MDSRTEELSENDTQIIEESEIIHDNEESDQNNDELSSESEDDEIIADIDLPIIKVKKDTEKYVITINDEPKAYVTSLSNCKNLMMDIARYYKLYWNNMYDCYISEYDDSVKVFGRYRFLMVIPFDRILNVINMHKISELDYEEILEKKEEKKEEKHSESKTVKWFSFLG